MQVKEVELYTINELSEDIQDKIIMEAVDFMREYKGRAPYASFVRHCGLEDRRTPDGFKYYSSTLSFKELNEFMRELVA